MKTAKTTDVDDDEMLPEYDFSKGVRGGFPELTGCGSFRLWSELHPHFDTGDQVELALREWVAEHKPRRRKPVRRLSGAPDSRFASGGLVRGFWFARDLVPFFPTEKSVNEALRAWLAEHKKPKQRSRP
jgi:hypothetical protein